MWYQGSFSKITVKLEIKNNNNTSKLDCLKNYKYMIFLLVTKKNIHIMWVVELKFIFLESLRLIKYFMQFYLNK